MYLIYVALCIPNNKLYFGITSKTLRARQRQHLYHAGRNPRLWFHRGLKKHGETNFVWYEIGRVPTKEDAVECEIALIRYFDTQSPTKGYNTSPGGELGALGREVSEETRQKKRGRRHSEATRTRMSLAHRGQVSWVKGKRLSEDQLQRRFGNKNRLGKRHSEEAKMKMRLAKLGKKRPDLSNKMRGNQNAKRSAEQ